MTTDMDCGDKTLQDNILEVWQLEAGLFMAVCEIT